MLRISVMIKYLVRFLAKMIMIVLLVVHSLIPIFGYNYYILWTVNNLKIKWFNR